MKHIKLFENWFSEIKLPWYADKSKKKTVIKYKGVETYSILHERYEASIKNAEKCELEGANFERFSDYDFWLDEYDEFIVEQNFCENKLKTCFDIPNTKILKLFATDIKSLKGSENRKFYLFDISYSDELGNLKYCPEANTPRFCKSSLLSYYGATTNNIHNFITNFSGTFTYMTAGYGKSNMPSLEQLNDTKFNAEIFCYFENEDMSVNDASSGKIVNPWNQIYNDPDEIENFEFLFSPFWHESEVFRDNARACIKDIDLNGNLSNRELW